MGCGEGYHGNAWRVHAQDAGVGCFESNSEWVIRGGIKKDATVTNVSHKKHGIIGDYETHSLYRKLVEAPLWSKYCEQRQRKFQTFATALKHGQHTMGSDLGCMATPRFKMCGWLTFFLACGGYFSRSWNRGSGSQKALPRQRVHEFESEEAGGSSTTFTRH
eukprot:2747688-Amphidinium_carterae.1